MSEQSKLCGRSAVCRCSGISLGNNGRNRPAIKCFSMETHDLIDWGDISIVGLLVGCDANGAFGMEFSVGVAVKRFCRKGEENEEREKE